MTPLDQMVLALCIWKENRGGGIAGMQSVANVVMNRAAKHHDSVYAEVYKPLQFTSMSYQHDPQLLIQCTAQSSVEDRHTWAQAQQIAGQAASGSLPDLTGNATNYVAESLTPKPSWCSTMTQTAIIAGQVFFK
jgi:N-acetylmuramoyl-L-alanine amidase